MEAIHTTDIALTISLAMVAGVMAQAMASHLRIPGIVLLLATGALLGPDALGLIDPSVLGDGLQTIVGFAVAVILFEGGLNLQLSRLRRESRSIRQLVTLGAGVTAIGAALAAHFVLNWDWNLSLLFGTLVIVTGPTVITPLLRRIKLKHTLSTVLEAEGVLIDPIGAIIAIVALDLVLHPSDSSLLSGIFTVFVRLGVGVVNGLIGGFIIAGLLRFRKLIPDGLENIFTLSAVWALFYFSNHLQAESGIMAVTAAGLVVGNIKTRVSKDLAEFKEQLTVMLIAMLFVLLAADVRFADIQSLGIPGLITVGILMFVVRPANIAVGTAGSGMSLRERAFMSWMAPRGIVAAAIASFFAIELEAAGIPGGAELRAMVFLVIAITVLFQGLTGGTVASLLKVRKKSDAGYAILGSNGVSRALGRALRRMGEEILIIDSNADAISKAEKDKFKVLFGNALEERTLHRSRLDELTGAVAMTPNEEINLMFVRRAHDEFKVPSCYLSLHLVEGHITEKMVADANSNILFGQKVDLNLWAVRVRRNLTSEETWVYIKKESETVLDETWKKIQEEKMLLPLAVKHSDRGIPISEKTKLKQGDEVAFLIFEETRNELSKWFADNGWTYKKEEDDDELGDSPE